jgi:stage V sporulation protein AF
MNTLLTISNYVDTISYFDKTLQVEQNFDVIGKKLKIASKDATLYFVDGFAKDEVMEKVLEFLFSVKETDFEQLKTATEFAANYIPYIESDISNETEKCITSILSGTLCLIIDGYNQAILIDARTYPARGVEEPDDDHVLRGSHDGFVETLIFNTALIRRRLRDPHLTMDFMQAGKKSKTDIVLCYLDNLVDKNVLKDIKDKIAKIDVNTLSLSQESLAECITKIQWYNPFPKIRYTERPDIATANIAEGKIVIIVDNSPSTMILPTSLFDFVQDINDFYFPPVVGTYLRLVRFFIFLLTIFLTPTWLLLMKNPEYIPSWLNFMKIEETYSVPLIFQLLLFEFVIDGLKLASLNTPSALSNSFSIVGALILGEFAVKSGWFVTDVVLYMAFVAIANFAQPSFELGYAFKLTRVMLLILTAIFNLWGFIGGLLLMLLIICTTKTVTGRSYIFPIIPFNKSAFINLFIRRKISKKNTE